MFFLTYFNSLLIADLLQDELNTNEIIFPFEIDSPHGTQNNVVIKVLLYFFLGKITLYPLNYPLIFTFTSKVLNVTLYPSNFQIVAI